MIIAILIKLIYMLKIHIKQNINILLRIMKKPQQIPFTRLSDIEFKNFLNFYTKNVRQNHILFC